MAHLPSVEHVVARRCLAEHALGASASGDQGVGHCFGVARGPNVMVGERDVTVGERNVTVGEPSVTVGERDVTVGERNVTVGERDVTVGELANPVLRVWVGELMWR